jgi:hypothetical protein
MTTALTVTIAGSSVSGVASTSKSYISWNWQQGAALGLTSDFSTGSATTTGNALYLEINLNDAYGAALTSTTGALTVSATTGANVGLSGAADSPVASSGTYSTAVSAAAPGDIYAKITEATAGAGWSGTVTVTYNGVVLATKSGSITGLPSKITITPVAVAKTNATTDTAIAYQVYDSVGNAIALANSAIAFNASDNTASVTNTGTGTTSNSTSTVGYLSVVGGTTAGVANVSVKTTLSNGTVVVSNAVPVSVGGAAASYTATLDKTKYAPGDVATLKVKFLDSKGNAAASSSSLYTIPTNAAPFVWNASLTLPQFTQIGTAGAVAGNQGANVYGVGANVSPDATGAIALKFTVGTTEASYSGVVDFPTVDGVAGSAQTVSYSVSSGSTSLNDVLKGIVALIASINKQIAALAKLVTKK